MENIQTGENNLVEDDDFQNLTSSLPKEKGWAGGDIYLYQGFWCPQQFFQGIISFQKYFEAHDTDIILVTQPKSGTVWLKALVFAIANRQSWYDLSQQHPLLSSNPHDLVPFLESKLYATESHLPNFSEFQSPRIFATHAPFNSLPKSIKDSNCRIIYLCRNPYDNFISSWQFLTKARPQSLEPLSIHEALDKFRKGVIGFGPFWDHVLGYWKESWGQPQKMWFLMYEDIKKDTVDHIKKLAEFMGVPFSPEEEREGRIEEISRLCSFDNLRGLEVNKSGKSLKHFHNNTIFRKGEVGDWVNHLSPEMVQLLDEMVEEKFGDSSLKFKTYI